MPLFPPVTIATLLLNFPIVKYFLQKYFQITIHLQLLSQSIGVTPISGHYARQKKSQTDQRSPWQSAQSKARGAGPAGYYLCHRRKVEAAGHLFPLQREQAIHGYRTKYSGHQPEDAFP